MQSHRNRDVQSLDHALNHAGDGVVAAHILAGTLGHAENDRRVELLRGEQDCFGPLQVVDVELAHSVFTGLGLLKHFFCGN